MKGEAKWDEETQTGTYTDKIHWGELKNNTMKVKYGVIKENATVLAEDGSIHPLPKRGTDKDGYAEVLLDAIAGGGTGMFARQSVRPFIGMRVSFYQANEKTLGYNFKILG